MNHRAISKIKIDNECKQGEGAVWINLVKSELIAVGITSTYRWQADQ